MIRIHESRRNGAHIYWGVEHHSTHPNWWPVAKSFLVESTPPYRESVSAIRFRLWRWELHVGTFKYGQDPEQARPTPYSDPEVAEELRRIYAVERMEDW